MSECPVFPKPLKNRASLFKRFFGNRYSMLDVLYHRCYQMRMGEVKLPGIHLYMVNQPDLVHRIMVSEYQDFPKHHLQEKVLKPLLGESIFTTNGAKWRKQRDMLNPAFEMVRVQHVFSLMKNAADEMMQRLEKAEDMDDFDIDAEMTYVTADIIFRTILSVRLDSEQGNQIFKDFTLFQRESPKAGIMALFRLPDWLAWLPERRRRRAGKDIRASIANVIRPRYEAAQRGEEDKRQDILSSVLRAIDPDTGTMFSFKEIVDQICMLFLAGHETSASALTWSLYLLSITQKVQDEAHATTREVMDKEGVTVSSVKSLSLVRDIFREALRLYPPVGFFPRECTLNTSMRDKNMKSGSAVVVPSWLIHRHREYWNNPNDFEPHRFSDKKGLKTPLKDVYMPFGMGPRICIGASFALQEATLILGMILRKYEVSLVPGFAPKPVGRLTIRSENGMHVRLKRRD